MKKKSHGISYHFEREAKIMAGLFLMLIVLAIFAAIIGPWVLRQIDIAKCLDSGGAFNSKDGKCYYELKDEN